MKSMFPDEIFKDIERKDGYIALLFYLVDLLILIAKLFIFLRTLLEAKNILRN